MSLIDTLRTLPGGQQPRKRKTLVNSRVWKFLATHRLVTAFILMVTVACIVLISFIGINSSAIPVYPNQIASVQITANAAFDYVSQEKAGAAREQIRSRVPRVYRLDHEPLKKFEAAMNSLLADLDALEREDAAAEGDDAAAVAVAAMAAEGDAAAEGEAARAEGEAAAAEGDNAVAKRETATAKRETAAAEREAAAAKRDDALGALAKAFNARGPYAATTDELRALLGAGDAAFRHALVETALLTLRELYKDGIQDPTPGMASPDGTATVFKISRPDGETAGRPVRTLEYARTELRVNLASEGMGRKNTNLIARLFDNGLSPNVHFDEAATTALENEAVLNMPQPMVHVEHGQVIIENGKRVSPERYEMLEAYRTYLLKHDTESNAADMQLFRRILVVLAMLLACAIYVRIEDPETFLSNGRLALLALVVVFNLALVRATYWLAELPYFVHHSAAASTLPYLAPTAIAPIIVAILIDAGSAIFMALLISVFTSVIYGSRLDVLVLTFFASMIATYRCRNIRRRGSIMRAALLGGVAVSCFALLFGIIDRQLFMGPDFTVPRQVLTGLVNGLVTGVIVVGLLPLIETLFQRTTDITLLELTDYNHPLLLRMQMEAPGTYHHSLVVAQLAENAANAIGANPLLARVCALFHDIGKTNKPGYFTENQRDRTNPHDENNPSLSALIIKSHVKDGVDLAIKHKLPRAVIDVIQQHHGTSLIRFFYQRARGEKRYQAGGSNAPMPAGNSRPPTLTPATRPPVPASVTRPPVLASATRPPAPVTRPPLSTQTAPGLEPVPVCETTYRYDGPKPRFKESAAILLADGVEAASRSMRKITPQHLGELIDQIFKDRFEDGQLDEAPLTLEDLNKIKASFTLTLLNMLHSRVAYPPQLGKVEEAPVEKEKGAFPESAGEPSSGTSSEPVK